MKKFQFLLLLVAAFLLAAQSSQAQCPSFSKRNNGAGGTCNAVDASMVPTGKVRAGRFTFTQSSPANDLTLTKVYIDGVLIQDGGTLLSGTKWFGSYNGASKDLCFYGNDQNDNATPAGHWRLYFTNPATGSSFICDYFITASGDPSTFNPGTIGADIGICAGTSPGTLTNSVSASGLTGTVAYQWQSSTTSATTGFTNISGATSATYTPGNLTQTTYFQRIASDVSGGTTLWSGPSNVVTVTVTAAPTSGTLSGNQSICVGATSTFSSTVSGGTWTSSNAAIATINSTSGLINGITAGTATMTYTVTGTGGCSNATATRTVTVTAAPSAGTISGTTAICSAGTSTLSSTVSGGTWTSSSTSVATVNSSTGVVTGVAAGTSTITYTVAGTGGCSNATTTATVTITTAPSSGTLAGTQSICVGSTTNFSSTVSGGTWSSSNTGIATINASTGIITGVAAGTATMTYTVTGTGGCANATATRTVTVTAAASAGTLSGSSAVCIGSTTTLSSTVTGGSWSSSSTSIATVNSSTGVVTGVAAGTATLTYTVAGTGGCSNASATTTITVQAVPAAAVMTVTQPTCTSPTGTITVTSPTGAGLTYSINNGAYQSSTTFSGLTAGTYSVRVKNAAGCTSATATSATVNAQPATPATPASITGNTTINSGSTQTYTAQAVTGATSYTWTLPTGWVGASTTNTITVQTNSNSGNITVAANANGCTSATTNLVVTVTVLTDSDGDGIPDSVEGSGDSDGDGIPNYLDLDSDNDGIPDSIEAGPDPSNPRDTDGDGIPDYLDLDSDGDGIPDSIEDAGCTGTAPCTPTDTDGDGIPNYLDLDSDNDGIPDSIEDAGCNGTAPCTPTDTDGDGIPNYLDLDSDNDGIPDSIEDAGCNGTAPCTPTDTDGDGIPNYLDLDSDNDGIPDSIEDAGCNGTAPCTPTDTDGDGIPNYLDLDSDNDGIPDSIEDAGCNGTAPCTPTDTDGDGIPNYLDLDSDNDGILDSVEDAGCNGTAPCTPTDTDGDGIPNYLDTDSDNDGCSDANEAYNSLTAQGTDGNLYYGNGNPPTVNSNGQVVGATYPTPSSNYTTAGAAPVITGGPTTVLTSVGATVTYTATATVSTGTVTYQWQVSTNNGSTWSNVALLTPYSGVTSSVLSINGVTAAMQGNRYRVIASQAGFICGADTSTAATLTVNFPPDAVNDVVSVAEDVAVSGNLLANDTDPNSDPLTVVSFVVNGYTYYPGTSAVIPGVGTILINANGTYTFTPVPNYNGTVPPIAYTISDGHGGTDSANLLITVTPVNDAPVANNDSQTTLEDTPVSGNVLTNDTDIDGNPLTVTQFVINGQTYTAGTTVTIPGVGALVINANGTYTFTPAPNYNGTVPPVLYSISDGQGGTASATLQITVTPVNDAPVANNDSQTTLEDTPVSGNVLTNDTDVDGNTLTVTQYVINGVGYPAGTTATIPGVGTLVINTNGTYTFTPAPNYNGTVPPVQYYISDGQGGTANATLQITVTPVNDAPVANNDSQTTLEDTPAIGNVLTNDTDVDGNPLTVTQFVVNGQTYTAGATATIPGVGTMVINANGTYTFTPAPNYNGPVPPAQYTISDGQGGTASATLQITITPVNDPPVANNDSQTTLEDTPAIGNVLTNDTDVDGNPLTVTQFVINGVGYPAGTTATIPGVGTLVINANGTYTFTPAPNYNGPVPPVQYTVSDGQGGTATANLQITIQSVADPDDIQINSTPVCNSGTVTLQASTTTVPNPIFKWYTDATLVNLVNTGATYVTPTITISTTYYVTVSGTGVLANQSGNAKSAVATILPAPGRPAVTALGPLTFCKDDSVVLKAGTAVAYQWYKNGVAITGATTDTYVAKTEGDFTVVVTNANGCPSAPSSPAVVKVPCVKGIHMPTVFTPNGDGKNDVVKPSIPGMKKFECFKVYNRWGNLVFECYNVLKAWDGTYKGIIQPSETYIWIVQGQDGQGKPMRETGMITLIR